MIKTLKSFYKFRLILHTLNLLFLPVLMYSYICKNVSNIILQFTRWNVGILFGIFFKGSLVRTCVVVVGTSVSELYPIRYLMQCLFECRISFFPLSNLIYWAIIYVNHAWLKKCFLGMWIFSCSKQIIGILDAIEKCGYSIWLLLLFEGV